jgi:hypothetical protein
MTESEKVELKEKIKNVMLDHLTPLGYPDSMSYEQIMQELKPMWLKIEEAGLITGDMNFHAFVDQAHGAYNIAKIREIMGI